MTKRVFVGLILDKSGSMQSIWKDTVAGLNVKIKAIVEGATEDKIDTYVSFYVFDYQTQRVFDVQPVNFLSDVADEDFQPKGGTGLYNCIADMVESLSGAADESNPDTTYLVYVFSDGQETVAPGRRTEIGKLIKDKQETGKWTFSFVGCDQDLTSVQRHLNIPVGNIASFSKGAVGTKAAFEASASSAKMYMKARARGATQVDSLYSEGSHIADLSNPGATFMGGPPGSVHAGGPPPTKDEKKTSGTSPRVTQGTPDRMNYLGVPPVKKD